MAMSALFQVAQLKISSSLLVPISQSKLTVGRSPKCTIFLADDSVSRYHAEIIPETTSVLLRDLKSRNGTFVNGERITELIIKAGDELRFGRVRAKLIFESTNDEPDEAEPATVNYPTEDSAAKPTEELLGNEKLLELQLSKAQIRVVEGLWQGCSEKEVAATLHLSIHTVHSHDKKIYRTLGVHSRAELYAKLLNGQP